MYAQMNPSTPALQAVSETDTQWSQEATPNGKTVILIVDSDSFLQELLASGIRLHNPSYEILLTESPHSAFLLLQRHKVDLVVSEAVFPGSDRGVEFLLGLEEYSPGLPVIVLTETPTSELQKPISAETVISKPPDMDFLLRRIDRLVQQSRESILRGITLESFLQVLQVEQKTCTLTVITGRRIGHLYIDAGELIHAETGSRRSKAAVFAMLSWNDYSIKITESCDAEPTITERLNGILMDWCVHKDHGLI